MYTQWRVGGITGSTGPPEPKNKRRTKNIEIEILYYTEDDVYVKSIHVK